MVKLKQLLIKLKSINYLTLLKELVFFLRFFLIVIVYLFFDVMKFISRWPIIRLIANPFRKTASSIYRKIMNPLNSSEEGEISSLDLVHLAVRHLKLKKARTIITIGGMSIGFGAVVFLLSLGYGVQRLVISRVARLDEMKQINVSIGQSSSLVINDQTLEDLKKIENVDFVIPMVSVVSKVNFNNSVSDVVAYGVTKQFLEQSAIQPVKGTLFEDYEEDFSKSNNETSLNGDQIHGQVAGASNKRLTGAKLSKELSQIRYSIYPLVWKAVYAEPSVKSKILGYTNRGIGEIDATEVWGETYESKENLIEGIDLFGHVFNPWISDSVPIWKKEVCDEKEIECIDGKYQMIKSGGSQELAKGYMTEEDVSINRYKIIASENPTFVEGDAVQSINFSLQRNKYVEVYSDVFKDEQMLGMYTSKVNDLLISGELVYGESYYSENGWGNVGSNVNGQNVGYWVRAKLPLWRKVDCSDCENVYLKDVDGSEKQIESLAYLRADQVVIEDMLEPLMYGQVLGESTASAEVNVSSDDDFGASDSTALTDEESSDSGQIALADGSILEAKQMADGTLDWTSMGGASDSASTVKREVVPLRDSAKKVAVVNRAMLKVLGIDEATAVGQTFNTTFMLDQEFFSRADYQAESASADFTIIGVIPEEKTPAYYLPFNDIKGLGVENYSQVKVVVKDQDNIKKVRQDIEASGFRTNSVVDTVGKINELFNTVRFVLSILGMVALSVAALGMFNTLTVSLLEKTREVGLMKAIGMKSNEVKRLFLAESIVMGLSGGICGLLLSALSGQLLSFALSVISVTKGLGYIQLVYIPFYLGFGVVALSFIIAVATGMYPSYRATKISALNALRYE